MTEENTWLQGLSPEEALKISEKAFRGNFENAAVGMAILDRSGKWLKVNQELLKILGYSEHEMYALTFQEITMPEDLDLDLEFFKEVLQGKRDNYQMEKRYFHKNGTIVYVILAVSVVRNDDGAIQYFISQIVDISEIKKTNRKINNLLKLTTSSNEQLKNFAHIVSHNLRSHSVGIASLIEMIEEENPEFFQNEMMSLLKTSSTNLLETINHLNEIVEINLSAEKEQSNLRIKPIAEKQIEATSVFAIKNKVQILNNLSPETKVRGIEAYIESMFLNFITNAIKYSAPERESFLRIDDNIDGEFVVITFKDNGVGINLALHGQKLFGLYKTFHAHEDSKGIGLFITKNMVEAMGGKIEVESEEGSGTIFKIFLKKSYE